MKKILLVTAFLLMLGVGVSRADVIEPGETPWWEGLDKLSAKEKLAECEELKMWHPDIKDLPEVLPPKKKWEWLDCDKLLKKHAGTQADTNPGEASDASPVTDTDDQTSQFASYVISGLLAVILSCFAFVLLWRARKPNLPRAL